MVTHPCTHMYIRRHGDTTSLLYSYLPSSLSSSNLNLWVWCCGLSFWVRLAFIAFRAFTPMQFGATLLLPFLSPTCAHQPFFLCVTVLCDSRCSGVNSCVSNRQVDSHSILSEKKAGKNFFVTEKRRSFYAMSIVPYRL